MTIPLRLLLFSLPSAVYVVVSRLRGHAWRHGFRQVGWSGASLLYLAVGLGVGALPGVLLLVVPNVLAPGAFDRPGIAQSQYAGWARTPVSFLPALVHEAIYTALGEEVLFRGLLGGLLIRRLGFAVGNLLQAGLFVLPHLLLLTVSVLLWPLLLAQYAAGWLFGWLMYKSGSILPGWLAHSVSNAFGALAFMS
ncbi:MAG: CPBP family glutamic-type intramembrane protease [Chloroflexota bacterium]